MGAIAEKRAFFSLGGPSLNICSRENFASFFNRKLLLLKYVPWDSPEPTVLVDVVANANFVGVNWHREWVGCSQAGRHGFTPEGRQMNVTEWPPQTSTDPPTPIQSVLTVAVVRSTPAAVCQPKNFQE